MGVAQYTSGYDSTENDAFQTVARQNPITSAEWKEGERRPLTHGQINTQKRKNRLWQLPSLVSSHAGIPCRPPLTGGIAASVRIVAFQPVLIGLEDSSQDVRRAAVLVQPMRAFDRPL